MNEKIKITNEEINKAVKLGFLDVEYYINNNKDLKIKKINPIRHFFEFGMYENRIPNNKCFITKKDIKNNNMIIINYFNNFINGKCKKLYIGDEIREKINDNKIFDADFYKSMYSDIVIKRIDPFYHFIQYGIYENRLPNQFCLINGNDIKNNESIIYEYIIENLNLKKRLILIGEEERNTILEKGIFNAHFYIEKYDDISRANIDPVEHFFKYGIFENRLPNKNVFITDKDKKDNPRIIFDYIKDNLGGNTYPVLIGRDYISRIKVNNKNRIEHNLENIIKNWFIDL